MNQSGCPSPDVLRAFATGDIPDGELDSLEEHLDTCPACEQTIAQLDGLADTVLIELRRRLPALLDTSTANGAAGSSTSRTEFSLEPELPEQLDDIRIIREVGRGGMGIVYEAYQGSLNRHVALKLLPERGDVARFKREAKAAGRLHHTNIVPVFGVGEYRGRHFYLMQYIDGRGLDVLLKARLAAATEGVSPWFGHDEAARIGAQAAEALAFAHAHGVVHRDVKPSNLLVDERGSVWITDFGLAQDSSDTETLTHTGDFLGTLRYMAPERVHGRTDARADVYGLGLSLYELICGRPAFPESDRAELLNRVLNHDPPRPRSINPQVPLDVETIVLKAMARDPAHRYPSASALADDLRRYLDGRSIRARQAGPWERTVRWCRRNPIVAALLSGISAVVLMAFAIVSFSYWYANNAFKEEARQRRAAVLAREEAERREKAERWERYRSSIAVAHSALRLQNSTTAKDALESSPAEHRNWEWRHLYNQLDGASRVWQAPGGSVKGLILSPSNQNFALIFHNNVNVYLYDLATGKERAILRGLTTPIANWAQSTDGSQIAAGTSDGTVRVWDAETARDLAVFKTQQGYVFQITFSPDGSRIAGLSVRDSRTGAIQIWNPRTGDEIGIAREWAGDTNRSANGMEFSPDSKLVAVIAGKYVHLCEAATGRQISALGPHHAPVQYIVFSRDGTRIASFSAEGSYDGYLWNLDTAKLIRRLSGQSGATISASFSSDSRRLITVSTHPDHTARLWDAREGKLLAILDGHKNFIVSVAQSSDGKLIATASGDQTARLWNAVTGQLISVARGHTGRITSVSFNADGSRMITASDDSTIRLWEAPSGELISVLRGHADRFYAAPVLTADGSRLLSGSMDGSVRLWDMNLVEDTGVVRGHRSFVYDVAFSPKGDQLASSAWDNTARLWESRSGRQIGVFGHGDPNVEDRDGLVTSVSFSGDGRLLATAHRYRGIAVWDVASQKLIHSWRVSGGHWRAEPRAALNLTGSLVAGGSLEGPIRLWNVQTGQEIRQLKGHQQTSIDVAFHPDGHLLASTGDDSTIQLWDVATGQNLGVLRDHTDVVTRVVFSTDGKLMASGSLDKTVRFWDLQAQKQIAVTSLGSTVYGLAFSPDKSRLAAACDDNTVRIIDVATHQEIVALHGHTAYVHAVDWSPDGTRLVSASGDHTLRFWDSLSIQDRAKVSASDDGNGLTRGALAGSSARPAE